MQTRRDVIGISKTINAPPKWEPISIHLFLYQWQTRLRVIYWKATYLYNPLLPQSLEGE